MQQCTAQQDHDGKTVAAFLRISVPNLTWNEARRHIQARRVLVNAVVCMDDSRRLAAGDRVDLVAQSTAPVPDAGDIRIVYQDEDVLVIDKPAGMESERRREQLAWSPEKRARQPSVVEALRTKGFRALPVHRLDRDSSGLMLYALSGTARDALAKQFVTHAIERTYLAIAVGSVQSIKVHNWIIRDRGDARRGCIDHAAPDAQEAISHFRVIENIGGKYTLLSCRLETGRTHQIRLHLASLGHPLCGEKLYLKAQADSPEILDPSNAPRHQLHSTTLSFVHPIDAQPLNFESILPRDMSSLLERLRKAL